MQEPSGNLRGTIIEHSGCLNVPLNVATGKNTIDEQNIEDDTHGPEQR